MWPKTKISVETFKVKMFVISSRDISCVSGELKANVSEISASMIRVDVHGDGGDL
jgi:hypothetical protein